MAVTEIPWGDGSSDKIYLTYASASGDQEILVSSDANTGFSSRSKVVTFSTGNISEQLTVSQVAGREPLPGEDEYFWCYYDITTTSSATRILGNTTAITGNMIVDGEEKMLATSYTFPTTGRHLVKFKYSGGTLNKTFSNTSITTMKELYFPGVPVTLNSTNSNSPVYDIRSQVKIVVNDELSNMLCFNYNQPTTLNIEIEIYKLKSWTLARSTNCIKNLTVKGTFTSIPSNSLIGFNGTNCYRNIWIESPNLTTFNGDAFRNMSAIETIVVNVNTPPSLTGSNVWGNTNSTFKLYVPYSSDHSILNAYKQTSKWSSRASQIYELTSDGKIPT